ncbi:YhdP family protein [Tropicimonas aquimaris]|uniref:AsmA-like C-terminal region-containing protein n=1 Tax=Tropicimonas aquimaris TaxID=914152 RepID=A0ABW3IRY0_9RHOB
MKQQHDTGIAAGGGASGPGDGQPAGEASRARKPARRKRRMLLWVLFVVFDLALVLALAILLGGLMLAGRDLPAPDWVAERAGEVLSQGLGGGQVEIGEVTLRLEHRALPEIAFEAVRVTAPNGADLAEIPRLGVSLDKSALFERRVQPKALNLEGAAVRLRRKEDGSLDLGFGGGMGMARLGSVEEALGLVRRTLTLPGIAPIKRIDLRGLDLEFSDERAGEVWRVRDGNLLVEQDSGALSVAVDFDMPKDGDGGAETDATVALRLSIGEAGAGAQFSALVKNVPARDIAAQAPALSWLKPLDAEVSGALITGLDEDGRMEPLNGTLEIGSGVFQPEAAAQPIPFDGARAYFGYRPREEKLTFQELAVSAPDGSFTATGHAYLDGMETGWPEALVGQFQFTDVRLDPPGFLPRPAHFDGGAVDLKVSLDPFEAKLGQIVLTTSDPAAGEAAGLSRLEGSGRVTADGGGWHVALDLGVDQIEAGSLMALWPFAMAPRTRDWIDRNLIGGVVENASAGLRLDQGARPDLAVTFEFRDAEVRALQSLPTITKASGYASTGRGQFALSLDAGQVVPPQGGPLDLAGSVFKVMDMTTNPRIAEIEWHSTSSVTAALSLLDQEPFRFLEKAGQPVALAEGRAALDGTIAFPMKRGIRGPDVEFDIAGDLTAVSSELAVPGRRLTSDRLSLVARPVGLALSGPARLDGVPFDGIFDLPLGTEAGSRPVNVGGTIQIGEEFVRAFGIGLPEGSVTGAGPALFTVELPAGVPPEYSLTSSLEGVGLALRPLGWSLPASSAGSLSVSGKLGASPSVDALTLEAAGLSAQGSVSLSEGGGLDRARFERVSLGGWLDAPVTLVGRGSGQPPSITVSSGQIDLRRARAAGGGGGGGGSGGGRTPISLSLDRLRITDTLSLVPFRGDISVAGGFTGSFSGNVNGAAPVKGTIRPGKGGVTAVRVTSDNAGAVFKAGGFFRQAEGGSMELTLDPTDKAGEYAGQLTVSDVRVRSASGLAALANSISLVGLIDEINGSGIVFSDVEAAFRLTPSYVQVTRSSGVGPSLGITMEGVYDLAGGILDMQGVFSPVYMVNSIGSIFTRRGEGLFGVTYRMRGPASNPSVEVNPLSALTPGMFREIFRAPPPTPRNGG